LAALSLACVLRDQGSLLALEAAPPPQDKGQAGTTAQGLSRDCPAPREDLS